MMITTGDTLHRAVKMALDSGEATTLEDALTLFRGYRLGLSTTARAMRSPTMQTALLTAVNTARRAFLGGVEVVAPTDAFNAPLRTPWRTCRTVGAAVQDLGGTITTTRSRGLPMIAIGDDDQENAANDAEFAVRVTFNGWTGAVTPIHSSERLAERAECPLVGVWAASVAVSEAFQHVRGTNPRAGRRVVGCSLWDLDNGAHWLRDGDHGPPLEILPSALWLIGLGHLGQAYLWTLGCLPYSAPRDVHIVLQDTDTLVTANDSTSPLTTPSLVGQRKTRAMAEWADVRGFRTSIIERPFAADWRVGPADPSVALVGVDNAEARAALEDVGFSCIIEAGLGTTANEYLAFQLHQFPGPQHARTRWGGGITASPIDWPERAAYRAMLVDGADSCGLTQLAGRSVGVPFVGTAVAALVIAEVIRMLVGGSRYGLIDGTLRTPGDVHAVRTEVSLAFNPGYTTAVREP